MSAKLIITPEAGEDISNAYTWYNRHRAGLGEEFLTCVEASIEAIQRNPEMYGFVYKDYRRGLVRRFPYAIFYEYRKNVITVYGVLHNARDPAKWHQRMT